jgi:hypothetical protein
VRRRASKRCLPPPPVIQDGRTLTSRYRLRGAGRVAFEIDGRDRSREMLIDPTVLFSTYLGGSYSDGATRIAVGSRGRRLRHGHHSVGQLPHGEPNSTRARGRRGARERGLQRVRRQVERRGIRARLLHLSRWLRRRPGRRHRSGRVGRGLRHGHGVVIGLPDQESVSGHPGPRQRSDTSVFVSKLSADGSELVYSSYLGGHYNNQATGIAIDSSLSAYVTGMDQRIRLSDGGSIPGGARHIPTTPARHGPTLMVPQKRKRTPAPPP